MQWAKSKLAKLIISILVCQFAGLLGSFFTSISLSTWYASLNKPSFTPPNWLFAPVWITLYLLMGIAFYLIWYHGFENRRIKKAMQIFSLQLFLNVFWTAVFFGLKSPILGLLVILLLWVSIAWTIYLFYRVSELAAYLLLPYILWVSYAVILNYSLLKLN